MPSVEDLATVALPKSVSAVGDHGRDSLDEKETPSSQDASSIVKDADIEFPDGGLRAWLIVVAV